ncbi:MAG: hypothetical protein J5832_04715 [Clostridia bacterium]|nr:hypothetical protein [Clostridia bacterium]
MSEINSGKEKLKAAMIDYCAEYDESEKLSSDEKAEISPKVEQKIRRLIKNQKHSYWAFINSVGKKVAVAAIAALLFFSGAVTALAVRGPVFEPIDTMNTDPTVSTTATEETAHTVQTTAAEPTEAVTETTTAEETTATEETTTAEETTEREIITVPVSEISSLPIIGEYQSTRDIPFEKFFAYYKNDDELHRWYSDNYLVFLDLNELTENGVIKTIFEFYHKNFISAQKNRRHFYVFTMAGCSGIGGTYYDTTNYYAYGYEYGEEYADNTVYTFNRLAGRPSVLCFGYHRYDVGDKYLLMLRDELEDSTTLPYKLSLKIEEIDGVEWVYADNHWSLEGMKCAVKITDEYENLMYKPGKDDDVIAYMEANGIENPTYNYKCELGAFIEEMLSKSTAK